MRMFLIFRTRDILEQAPSVTLSSPVERTHSDELLGRRLNPKAMLEVAKTER